MNYLRTHKLFGGLLALFICALFIGSSVFAQTPDPDTFCPSDNLLGFWSDNRVQYGSEDRYLNLPLDETIPSGSLTYAFLVRTSDFPLTITADGVPNGVVFRNNHTQYGAPVVDGYSHNAHNFFFTGRLSNEGPIEVELEAESSRCGSDVGRIFIRGNIQPAECQLQASPSTIEVGGTATLTWDVDNGEADSIDPDIPGSNDYGSSGSRETGPLQETTTFIMSASGPQGGSECHATVRVGNATGASLQLVRRVLEIPHSHNGGTQTIAGAAYTKGKFIFSGDCGVDMSGNGSGGGLWTVNEDGSGNVQEREACLDAGSGSNMIYYHANTGDHFGLAGERFFRGNGSAGSCLIPGPGGDGDCSLTGPGANKAVLYDISGGAAQIVSTSPGLEFEPWGMPSNFWGTSNYALGTWINGLPTLFRLPSWSIVQEGLGIYPDYAFREYIIDMDGTLPSGSRSLKVYRPSDNGLELLSSFVQPWAFFSRDYSTSPEQLTTLTIRHTGYSGDARIIWYEDTGNGLRKAKEYTLPSNFPNQNQPRPFTTWGNYIITSVGTGGSGAILVWDMTTNQEIERVDLPLGGGPSIIVGSPSGHIAIASYLSSDYTRTSATIYKIGSAVPPTPGGGGGTATSTGPSIYDIFDGPSEPVETIFGSWLRALRGIPSYDE